MKVKNVNGTADGQCRCGSWLKHWSALSGQKVSFCPEINCTATDLVGAHVQRSDARDDRRYILPLCTGHHRHPGVLEVSNTFSLVSANKRETCEKKSE